MTAPITLTPTAAQMREVHAVTRFEPSRSVGFVIHHDRHGVVVATGVWEPVD